MCQLKTKVPQHCSSMHSLHLNASIWWLFLKLIFHQKLPVKYSSSILMKNAFQNNNVKAASHDLTSWEQTITFWPKIKHIWTIGGRGLDQWTDWHVMMKMLSGDEQPSILRHQTGLCFLFFLAAKCPNVCSHDDAHSFVTSPQHPNTPTQMDGGGNNIEMKCHDWLKLLSGDEWRSILRHWIGLSWTQFFLVKTRIQFWIKEQSRVFKNP